MQSEMVARQLEAAHHNALQVQLSIVTTSGDIIQDRPLHEFGGKGLFTKELEQALLKREVDFAVHSFKDVPVTMPLVDTADLVIAAVPQREDPRDCLACLTAKNLLDLPKGARVGTGSLRRQAQILSIRPDLQILPIRGNVDTRLRKLKAGEYDAVILAAAGVKRAGLFDPALMTPIDTSQLLPAAGQGALALECRRDTPDIRTAISILNHPDTFLAAALEREIVLLLNGDCHSPIAALATIDEKSVRLQAAVAARDGKPPIVRADFTTSRSKSSSLPKLLVDSLKSQGVNQLLSAT
jgi:hydroxymethylbilane synthase